METLLSLAVGLALSAACGFRIFIPLFVLSLASLTGHVDLAPGFDWLGTSAACTAFGIATVAEVAAYYIPWVDNALDQLTTPAAVIAGILVTASMVTEMSPFLRWSLAVIAGGGVAGVVQSSTVTARTTTSLATAGMGNSVLATFEAIGSLVAAVLALLWPMLALVVIILIVVYALRRRTRRRVRHIL